MTSCTLCGRPVYVKRRLHKKSSRSARAGRASAIKDHDLCQKCFSSHMESTRAAELAYAEQVDAAWEERGEC